YVWEATVDRVTELIKRYVKENGCAAAVDFESDKPSPAMARRTQREFTVSDPRNGIISIWEDGAWGDKRLARYLSKELETPGAVRSEEHTSELQSHSDLVC